MVPRTSTTATQLARFVVSGRDDGRRPRSEVALTFHTNGDLRLAQRLLDVAASHEARLTCFIVGSWLEANPSWGRRLLDGGHELANHTFTHPEFAMLSPAAMRSEIVRCRDVLIRLTGDGGRYFRPSGTDDGLARPSDEVMAAASEAGYSVVLGWDVDPYDYKDPGPAAVRDRVLADVQPGSIVSLHFGHVGTVDALDEILGGLAARALRPVTVTEMLS
ncbi:MAG: polysaccharide deacetylase family protein [Acidimicrobiales bacterium]|nr:polysaccharide deacetylase family protein [Acidimicrobiales bacterium]